MARSLKIECTVTIDDIDYEVEAVYHKGSKDYFDKGYGNWLPGDPDELEDITINDTHRGVLVEFESFEKVDRDYIEECLMVAAEEETISRESDEGDRRYDAMRDR